MGVGAASSELVEALRRELVWCAYFRHHLMERLSSLRWQCGIRVACALRGASATCGEEFTKGVSGRLVGPAAFKAVEGSFARPLVGSIPIHSRSQSELLR